MRQEEIWDSIAIKWAEFRTCPLKEVAEFLDRKLGKVLDLGCGSGRNFIDDKNLEFYGVDFSGKMVKLATERKIAKEVIKSSSDKIPYDDGFFDAVLLNSVLHCVDSAEKRRKTLEEIYRVLKDGGEALISVWGRKQDRLKNRSKEGFVPWNVGEKKYERYTYIYEKDELVKDLESLGFEIVSLEEGENIVVVVRKD